MVRLMKTVSLRGGSGRAGKRGETLCKRVVSEVVRKDGHTTAKWRKKRGYSEPNYLTCALSHSLTENYTKNHPQKPYGPSLR